MVKTTSNLYVPNRQKQSMNIRASEGDYTKPLLLSGTTKPAEKNIKQAVRSAIKIHLLHLVGILFPHIIDNAWSKPHQTT
jgi:hypothetical protein